MAHGIFCFCPRCLNGGTSKKGKNRKKHIPPAPRPRKSTNPHGDGRPNQNRNGNGRR